jgi:3-hydroxyisobutyrate dehydrogenase-like beta-hydroxyacid dehydrogenase
MGRLNDGRSISGRFIGLGTMGEAMALTLVKAGRRLLVWNRTRAKAEVLAVAGADVALESADVFAQCATVFLMLVDGRATDTVLDRGGAAFVARVTGRTIVHMGTTSPAYSRELEADIRCVGDTTSRRRSQGHASPLRQANSSPCSLATQMPSPTFARC